MRIMRLVIFAFAAFVLAVYSYGQTTNGLITGAVTDSTGASLPGVSVTVTNPATGVVRNSTTNESGIYVVPQLAPGTYNLSIARQGFPPKNALIFSFRSIKALPSTSRWVSRLPPRR